jgi:hypothetical protein
MRRSVLVLALLLATACRRAPSSNGAPPDAAGGPGGGAHARTDSADAGLARQDPHAYGAAITEGRKLFRAKNYVGAAAAFERATRAMPKDADAWSELGWAQFNAGDLVNAEHATRASLARTGTDEVRGATLYNLGRINEQRGFKDSAVDAYAQSFSARPNRVVLTRLRALDPARADLFAPFAATRCAGPFATRAALCTSLVAMDSKQGDRPECSPTKDAFNRIEGPTTIPSVPAPYVSIALHSTVIPSLDDHDVLARDAGGEELYADEAVHVVLETTEGFFASRDVMIVHNPGAFGVDGSGEVTRFALEDVVPGGAPEVVLEVTYGTEDQNMGGDETYTEDVRALVVCGIATGGKPACTPPALFARHETHSVAPALRKDPDLDYVGADYDRSFALAYAFDPPGKVTFSKNTWSPRGGKPMAVPEEASLLLGAQTIRMP